MATEKEERAYKLLNIKPPKEGEMTTGMPFKPGGLERMFFNGYVRGATEQQEIDAEKASTAFCIAKCGHPSDHCECLARVELIKAIKE